jgi:hypothetical protein
MIRPTKFKRKIDGKWIDTDDIAAYKAQKAASGAESVSVDVQALPPKEALDPDVPLEQLVIENEDVAALITLKGKIRSGLNPSQHEQAKQIIEKYRG